MPFVLVVLLASAFCFGETTVKAADIIKKLEKGESVEMKDAVVEGVLDFSNFFIISAALTVVPPKQKVEASKTTSTKGIITASLCV